MINLLFCGKLIPGETDMLRRKIYDRLPDWKANDNGSCALLIAGARRVGKSFIAREFTRAYVPVL